jgi:putative ABC transport system permease protein
METFWQDIRYGVRMLRKDAGFTAIALLTLALGIGANTAIFSILDAVLLKPLPFPEPDRLMAIWGTDSKAGEAHRALSYPDFTDYRDQNRNLEALAAYTDGTFTLTGNAEPAQLHGGIVSASLLSVLRVAPAIGTGFTPEDDKPGARVVLLSHSMWKGRYGGDPAIIGRTIALNERRYTVIGVMPPSFQFPLDAEQVDLWTTMAIEMVADQPEEALTAQRGAHFLYGIARLKTGTTLAQANADAAAVSAGLEKQYPDENSHLGLALQPAAEALVGNVRASLLMLFGAVGFLLLIACANVANLLLARGASREREMAVRGALGAGHARLVRQLLTESIILSLAGGGAGLVLAAWATRFLSSLPSLQIPRLAQARLDWVALLFMTGASVLTGVIFGIAPALHSSKLKLAFTLKEGGRTATAGTAQNRVRRLLVIGEVSLALVLVIGASLLAESLVNLWRVPPGFDPSNVLTFNVNLPAVRYAKSEQSIEFYRQLIDRIRSVNGVKDASGIFPLPLSDSQIRTSFAVEGRPVAKGEEPRTHLRVIDRDYFKTMHIPLLAGRMFTNRDDAKGAPVAIINEAFAKKVFPSESPLGKRIRPDAAETGTPPMREIVGVVGNVKYRHLWEAAEPECYMPYDQLALGDMTLVARTPSAHPLDLLPAMREQVKAVDPEIPVFRARTMENYISDSIAQRRFTGVLCGTFAAVGLLLAVVGLYGVMSYLVAQRTHEIGIRVAVGAGRRDILRMVLDHGVRLCMVGMVIGTIGALALSRVLASQLFGVTATDMRTYAIVILTLTGVAAAACYFPARRAAGVDPMVALRYE